MFESRLQTAQVILWLSFISCMIAILTLIWAPIVVGIFFLVLSHAAAAVGCYLYADVKGYPGLIGIPIGVAVGFVGWIAMIVLPDQTEESAIAEEKRLALRGLRRTRRKDPGFEVLDDDE
jgi:hypothetical protein